jgi:hypothetical protein
LDQARDVLGHHVALEIDLGLREQLRERACRRGEMRGVMAACGPAALLLRRNRDAPGSASTSIRQAAARAIVSSVLGKVGSAADVRCSQARVVRGGIYC